MASGNSDTGSRIPPGGKSSNLFESLPNQPRKVRDHQKSSIFGPDQTDSPRRFLSPRPAENTKQRLFGGDSQIGTPRRVNDTWRSVVFSASEDCLSDKSLKSTPKRSPSSGLNPITGQRLDSTDLYEENGIATSQSNGFGNGIEEIDSATTNGKKNGDMGQNGHHDNSKNGDVVEIKSSRQPPGGKAHGIF